MEPLVKYTTTCPLPTEYFKTKNEGQLKLYLGEAFFFSKIIPMLSRDKPVQIVYAGSGQGYHLPFLLTYLPSTWRWHLYDPDGHCDAVQRLSPSRFFVHEAKFDSHEFLRANPNIHAYTLILISDIRTKTDGESVRMDHDLHDMWIEELKPDFCWLKWRLPYDRLPFTYIQSINGDKDIYIQPFTYEYSGECRMFIKGSEYERVTLSPETMNNLEERLYHFNRTIRNNPQQKYSEKIAKEILYKFRPIAKVLIELRYLAPAIKNASKKFNNTSKGFNNTSKRFK